MDIINPYIHGGEAVAFDGFGNRSRSFDGVSDEVNLGDSDDFSFDNAVDDSPLSFSVWFKSNLSVGNLQTLLAKATSNTNVEYLLTTNSVGGVNLVFHKNGSGFGSYIVGTSSTTYIPNQWTHVVATYDGGLLATGIKVYINGVDDTGTPVSGGAYDGQSNTTADLLIGNRNTSSGQEMSGKMADVRIYDSVLTAAQVSDIYNGTNITTNLVGHWLTDADNVLDAAGTNHGTNYGSKYSYDNPSPPVEFGRASRSFSGGDRVHVADNADLPTGSQTVSLWAKLNQTNLDQDLVSHWDIGDLSFIIYLPSSTGGQLRFYVSDDGSTPVFVESTISLVASEWAHITCVFVPNTKMSIYIDGALAVEETSNIPSGLHDTAEKLSFGRRENWTSTPLNGKLADVRIYDTDLSSTEIYELYKGVDHRTNLIGQWLTDNDDVEDKAGTNDGTNFGSTYSYDNPPMDLIPSRQASRSFDGGTSYVNTNASFNNVFNSNFTFACWAKCEDGQPITTNSIFGNQNSNPVSRFLCGVLSNGARVAYYNVNGNVSIAQTQAVLSNEQSDWFHLVVTVTPSGNSIYLDGSLQALDATNNGDMSGLTMGDYNNSTANCFIGARSLNNSPSLYMDGNLADVRIYDTDLTASQILDIYNGTTDRTNLVGQWLTNSNDVLDHAGTNDGINIGSIYSADSPS